MHPDNVAKCKSAVNVKTSLVLRVWDSDSKIGAVIDELGSTDSGPKNGMLVGCVVVLGFEFPFDQEGVPCKLENVSIVKANDFYNLLKVRIDDLEVERKRERYNEGSEPNTQCWQVV
jgi:hypothetical protein